MFGAPGFSALGLPLAPGEAAASVAVALAEAVWPLPEAFFGFFASFTSTTIGGSMTGDCEPATGIGTCGSEAATVVGGEVAVWLSAVAAASGRAAAAATTRSATR